MNACISPGTSRCSSLRWPSTISTSFCTRRGTSARPIVRLALEDEPRQEPRPPREEPAADDDEHGERDRAYEPRTFRSSALIAGHDLVQVADHRVVGAREDRRLRVAVDREDLLRALRAGDVLRRAADAARDVQIRGDLRARLPDLVGVRAPAGGRDDARAADRAAEQAGELFDDVERLRRADAAAAADDDLRVAQRDAAARLGDGLEHARRAVVARGAASRPEPPRLRAAYAARR